MKIKMKKSSTLGTPAKVHEYVEPKKKKQMSAPDNRLINRSNVKNLALNLSKNNRAGYFTRVSKQFLNDCNDNLAAYIRGRVHSAPSKGVTL